MCQHQASNMDRKRVYVASSVLAIVLLVAAMAGAGAGAQTVNQPLGKERPDILGRWQQTLSETDGLLKSGEWQRARGQADRLLDEMITKIEGGAAAAPYLASAAVQRGLAEAGLGNTRDALWDFEMAVALHPQVGKLDLVAYGEAGATLAAYRTERGDPWSDYAVSPGVRPPKKVRAPHLKYPRAKRVACLEEAILVRSIIDSDGILQGPTLLTRGYPVLGFAAMDTLRQWRFKPARLDGRPVPVIHSLVVNYNIVLCRNLAARQARQGE